MWLVQGVVLSGVAPALAMRRCPVARVPGVGGTGTPPFTPPSVLVAAFVPSLAQRLCRLLPRSDVP